MVGGDSSNPILEVWRWNPASTLQFVDNVQNPINTDSQWVSWDRNVSGSSLQRMVGNSAYLVRVGTSVSSYTWNIKGKAVAPLNQWTSTGLNLIGFSTVAANPPTFDNFLSQSPGLQQSAELYYYRGGDLGSNNPARLLNFSFRSFSVKRGTAYWMRTDSIYNHYFGPFELNLEGHTGIDFDQDLNSFTFHLKNLTTNILTVSAKLIASEAPPLGESNIVSAPPLLLRSQLNVTNLTYDSTNLPLNVARSWTLAPAGQVGSEIEAVLGLNRSAIAGAPGSYLAGVIRFTDSLGYNQVDAPVTAVAGSSAGLWVGKALVTQVAQYLKTYQRDAENNIVVATNGQYVVTNIDTSLGAVAKPFPLRLIVHNPEVGGNAVLLQRVFVGMDAATNSIIATQEKALNPNFLKQSRRITAPQLPWSQTNRFWPLGGRLSSGTTLAATVTTDYDDAASNPFLHSYHPDHDNLDATFQNELPPGAESYTIRRQITLNVNPPGSDFDSLISGAQTVGGDYLETITMVGLPRAGNTNDVRQFQVRGTFILNRISPISTLTTFVP